MTRSKSISILASLLLVFLTPAVMAQAGFGDFPQEVQSTTTPAGTAVEPGSQLLFLLDSGIDASGLDPTSTLRDNGITAPAFTNFISITNTNPTDAITLHFRYFNEHCIDVLDFLVVLTCNDTMLIDAFNYTVPGTATNVSQRFFGELAGSIAPIPAGVFGDGRFLLFVTASGDVGNDSGEGNDTSPVGDRGNYNDPEDLDEFADWLFPFELVTDALVDECPAVDPDTIGLNPGGVNDNNLNIFNSSAISFNFLNGFHTIGVARAGGLAAHGVTAWTRPAVNVSVDLDEEDSSETPDGIDFSPQDVVGAVPTAAYVPRSGDRTAASPLPKEPDGIFDFFDLYNIIDDGLDGDGPLAPKRTVLAGSEEIWLTLVRDATLVLPANYFYLRQDAHGGDTVETNCEGFTAASARCDDPNPFFPTPSVGGALDWTLFPAAAIDPLDQSLYLISVKDDYNGSNNPNNSALGLVSDNAYRLDPAATYYELAIFNNDEERLDIPRVIPPISPPPPFTPLVTRVAVKCISAFNFENQSIPSGDRVLGGPGADFVFTRKLHTFSVQDLYDLAPPLIQGHLEPPVDVNDELGPGWIRFDRILTRDYYYDASGGVFTHPINYDGERGSYVTIAKNTIFQSAFGVAWYLPQSATDFDPNP